MAITATLSRGADEINLNSLLTTDRGVQVLKGLVGFGLPGVDVFYTSGAGDGATYRGRRVLPRDLQLPLYYGVTDRARLKEEVAKLSRVLDGTATLTLTDGTVSKYVEVQRVSGGEYVYGEDTTGERDLVLNITVRAPQPFWRNSVPALVSQTGSGIGPNIVVTNEGTVESPSIWTFTGPGDNPTIVGPDGTLKWIGRLTDGEYLIINSEKGTVIDGLGENRYGQLAPAPRFPKAPVGDTTFSVDFPTYSPSLARTNMVTNPSLETGTAGWSAINGTGSRPITGGFSGNARYSLTGSGQGVSGELADGSFYFASVPGKAYTFTLYMKIHAGGSTDPINPYLTGHVGMQFYDVAGTTYKGGAAGSRVDLIPGSGWVRATCTGVAPAGGVTLKLNFGASVPVSSLALQPSTSVTFDAALLEEGTSIQPYFDGSTPDATGKDYAWTGTAHASTSTLTSTPTRANASLNVSTQEMEWMVV